MKRVLAALTLAAGLLVAVSPGPAVARGATVVSPSEGQEVPLSRKTIQVDVTFGTYEWVLTNASNTYEDRGSFSEPSDEATAKRHFIYVDPFVDRGSYTFSLFKDDSIEPTAEVQFYVGGSPSLNASRVYPAEFYPLVKDRYRDTVRFTFESNARLRRVEYQVRDSRFRVVAQHRGGDRLEGRPITWQWDGRNDGKSLPVGLYTIEATAIAYDGRSTSIVSPRIKIATDFVDKRVKQARRGMEYASPGVIGTSKCGAYARGDSLLLDCRDVSGARSSYVRARYTFALPSSATNLTWRINGATLCCDAGVIERTGRRLDRTRYQTTVLVTGYRAFRVDSTTLSYTTKVRR